MGIKKLTLFFGKCILSLLLILNYSCSEDRGRSELFDPIAYVNPIIGTGDYGHTFPGATLPFGMVQLSPDMGNTNWNYCSGYYYPDSIILGFSHTHLSGTGIPDMGDFLFMPYVENVQVHHLTNSGIRSEIDHGNEIASPGYYRVMLQDYNILAELTATQRCGFHRYKFPQAGNPAVFVNLFHTLNNPLEGKGIMEASVKFYGDTLITGFHRSKGWAKDRPLYFAAQFSKGFTASLVLKDGDSLWNPGDATGKDIRLFLKFGNTPESVVMVKVGISSVDEEGAIHNLRNEIPDWNFDEVKQKAESCWRNELEKIQIQADEETKKIFYTSLYHSFLHPSIYSDVDGRYRGADQKIHQDSNHVNYHIFSLWDTYRALHPLFTIIQPDRNREMILSMLDFTSHSSEKILPIWSLANTETYCMIGNHAVPVIADAFLKEQLRGIEDSAFDAVKKSLTKPHFNSPWDLYNKYGYLPYDLIKTESVSKTLEFCFDDWCAAQMALKLNRAEDYEFFLKRSQNYKNLFDPVSGFMRAKDSKGQWLRPFDAFKLSHASTSGGEYTEGNAWQYSWYVPHQVDSLINMLGGEKSFIARLDSLFQLPQHQRGEGFVLDVTGLIGQYAHGNEPCHHIAYFFSYAGYPHKTQERLTDIMNLMYKAQPGGLCGNDDCGQMSAWYIFTALGFYPLNPGSGEYILGRPFVEEATVKLPDNKTLRIKTKGFSPERPIVKAILRNGKILEKTSIIHKEMIKGGELIFEMSSK